MKRLDIPIIALLLLAGCSKIDDANKYNVAAAAAAVMYNTPNNEESPLLGTWHLKEQVIKTNGQTTDYTEYDNLYLITFSYGIPDTITCHTNYKYFVSTWMPNTPVPSDIIIPSPSYGAFWQSNVVGDSATSQTPYMTTANTSCWYCNASGSALTLVDVQSNFVISGNVLTVTWTNGERTIVSTLQK